MHGDANRFEKKSKEAERQDATKLLVETAGQHTIIKVRPARSSQTVGKSEAVYNTSHFRLEISNENWCEQ